VLDVGKSGGDVPSDVSEFFRKSSSCWAGQLSGDPTGSAQFCVDVQKFWLGPRLGRYMERVNFALLHDMQAAGQIEMPSIDSGGEGQRLLLVQWNAKAGGTLSLMQEDWPQAISRFEAGTIANAVRALPLLPWLAYAKARNGDAAGADAIINATPSDCYRCLRVRGKLAALKSDWVTAEKWFAEAAKQGPSMPFANTDWAETLIAKGDFDGAIAQSREAVKRSPHFADAYEAWAEALLLKGDAKDSIAQFESAAKYAPKWGRVQISWGRALTKLGHASDAQAKFKVAESLFLVPSEKVLLANANR
jgi:tetratricopeptide (TPR) repeat protein